MSEFKELQEVTVCGSKGSILRVKVGEKICFIDPDVIDKTKNEKAGNIVRFIIKQRGRGPFDLLGIKFFLRDRLRDGHSVILFCFVDSHGNKAEINKYYLTKHE